MGHGLYLCDSSFISILEAMMARLDPLKKLKLREWRTFESSSFLSLLAAVLQETPDSNDGRERAGMTQAGVPEIASFSSCRSCFTILSA